LGIGNEGSRYKNNRHNVGFIFLDYFAEKKSLSFIPKDDYLISRGYLPGSEFILIKPSTFVNNSGIAALQIKEKYNLEIADLLVVVDDINIGTSEFRIRKSGGNGGHNGVASIIYHLNSNQFPRLRIGIGNEFNEGEMASYVLSDFKIDEKKTLFKTFDICLILIEEFIKGGIKAMFDANSRLKISGKRI
jgi:PTH1 family peptidyl-tRNA hydrolase